MLSSWKMSDARKSSRFILKVTILALLQDACLFFLLSTVTIIFIVQRQTLFEDDSGIRISNRLCRFERLPPIYYLSY